MCGIYLKSVERKNYLFYWRYNLDKKFEPDYIVMNAALPLYEGMEGSSTMGQEDVKKCCNMYKKPKVIVTHLDSMAHCFCTSETIKNSFKKIIFLIELLFLKMEKL